MPRLPLTIKDMQTATATLDPRFPVGKFQYTPANTAEDRNARIEVLAQLPAKVRQAVSGISKAQLETPYREGGWTVRQVVHHLADSHANAFSRTKLALTEDKPTIKPYNEAAWAELPDNIADIEPSLRILEGVHARWVALLRSLSTEQFEAVYQHPERGPMTLEKTLALYEWHSNHHLAHIHQALGR